MLNIITKDEFFDWLELGIAQTGNYSLKGIQDAWGLSLFQGVSQLKIAEVGGGNSRVLHQISLANECWNLDKFEGFGLGPTEDVNQPNVKIIRSYIGEFDPAIPDSYFDAVFSISVVEHLGKDKLDAFFADCHRILKPGGLLAHAIDLYIFDAPDPRVRIIDSYRSLVEKHEFEWLTPPTLDGNATFQCKYASNADIEMHQWNSVAPKLTPIRVIAQSVSIQLIAFKKPDPDPAILSSILECKFPKLPQLTDRSSSVDITTAHSDANIPSVQNSPTSEPNLPRQSAKPVKPVSSQKNGQLSPVVHPPLLQRIANYYQRWPILLAGSAIAFNLLTLFNTPYRWLFGTGSVVTLLFLIGHAASKADYVLAEVEELKKTIAPPKQKAKK
ncbi:class I SAM-dependent methyltransferase [Egbenema bharatensis]|uniref:class I SAM-dependent methyltransferase n=1 Tax=Egbenema bharatensis TaxID=3463334 RepID=UPI003A8BFCE7